MFPRLIFNNDKAYKILRVLALSNVSKKGQINREVVDAWKIYLEADEIAQEDNNLLYLKQIQDVDYEEIKETKGGNNGSTGLVVL